MYEDMLKKVEVLHDCSWIEKSFIVMNLKTILFMPGDTIIQMYEDGNELYFLSKGQAEVFINKTDEREL